MTYLPNPAFETPSQSLRVSNIRPSENKAVPENLIDTTNLAIATYYRPSSTGAPMLPQKDLSLTGKLIDADGTVTLTVEATNDEDLAAGDWHDVTRAGYRPDNNTTGNVSITVTNGTETFAIDFDNLNYNHYRVMIVCAGSATNTVIVKQRRKAL